MASIQKRKNSWAVVYSYKTEDGTRKQKWENYKTFKEAKIRKATVEKEIETNQFIAPTYQTLSDFLDTFVEIYGTENWGPTSYKRNCNLIENYIKPFIGNLNLQEVTALGIEKYYIQLSKTESVSDKHELVSSGTVVKVHKLLKTAFKTAKLWDLIIANPFDKVRTPKHEYAKRDIWDSETIIKALEACEDPKLAIAIHLSFACSLRLGEVLGLQWKNVFISDEDLNDNNARLQITCQYDEISKEAMNASRVGKIYFEFPSHTGADTKYVRVLKSPKTKTSERTVWIPNTLALILRKWREDQKLYMGYFGCEYHDYDLVVCLENGNPVSKNLIRNSLNRLIKDNDLPPVVFHSLRHSSTTYKLKLNHGDIKATQGDTGHAQADMITDLYAHILDEDRKVNAQKFNDSFYTQSGEQIETKQEKVNVDELIDALKTNPELLKQVLSALQ